MSHICSDCGQRFDDHYCVNCNDNLKSQLQAERDARLKAESACAEMRAVLGSARDAFDNIDADTNKSSTRLIANMVSRNVAHKLSNPAGEKVLRDMASMRAALENIVTSLVPYAPNSDEGIAVAQAKQALADLESTK